MYVRLFVYVIIPLLVEAQCYSVVFIKYFKYLVQLNRHVIKLTQELLTEFHKFIKRLEASVQKKL